MFQFPFRIGPTIGKMVLAKNTDLFPLTLETPKELQLGLPQTSKIYELREPFFNHTKLSSFLMYLVKQKVRENGAINIAKP